MDPTEGPQEPVTEPGPGQIDLRILPAPPPTLPPWAKVLWYTADVVAAGTSYLAYNYGMQIRQGPATAGEPDGDTWRRFQFEIENTASLDPADNQAFTLDFVNYTGGAVDNSWTTADYTAIGTPLAAFLAAIASHMSSYLSFTHVKSYRQQFLPISNANDIAQGGPPEHDYPVAVPGGATSTVAAQACSTITEIVPLRAHWGRMYTPTLGVQSFDSNGRVAAATVQALADALSTFTLAMGALDFHQVVVGTRSGGNGTKVHALSNVTGIRCDDVPDVLRSRRYRSPVTRITVPITT